MERELAETLLRRRKRLRGSRQTGLILALAVVAALVGIVFSLGSGRFLSGLVPFFDGQSPGPRRAAGGQLYEQYCFGCHGLTGDGNAEADIPALNQNGLAWTRTRSELEDHILDGGETMPELKGLVSPSDASRLIDFIQLWWTQEQIDAFNNSQ